MKVMDGSTEMAERKEHQRKCLLLLEFSLRPSEAGRIKVNMLARQEGK